MGIFSGGDKAPDIKDIALGSRQRDTVTGFEGIVVGRADYLTGCAQALIETGIATGEVAARWFDYPRLELVAEKATPVADSARRRGGPAGAPTPGGLRS